MKGKEEGEGEEGRRKGKGKKEGEEGKSKDDVLLTFDFCLL